MQTCKFLSKASNFVQNVCCLYENGRHHFEQQQVLLKQIFGNILNFFSSHSSVVLEKELQIIPRICFNSTNLIVQPIYRFLQNLEISFEPSLRFEVKNHIRSHRGQIDDGFNIGYAAKLRDLLTDLKLNQAQQVKLESKYLQETVNLFKQYLFWTK